ncbi:DEAD/DEAH box helicase family protein [Streptomyces sp. RPA4-5]|nr:DEAD/DEAH box helicase family protein [Streptomyces sp. RPA4-5]
MIGVCSLRPTQVAVKRITLTTDARLLAQTLASHTGPTIVFATYSSLRAITRAHRRHRMPPWSIAIIDEAHRSSGSSNKQWGAIHKDTSIPAQRRLYMTATPAHGRLKTRRRGDAARTLPPRTIRPNRSPPWTTRPSTAPSSTSSASPTPSTVASWLTTASSSRSSATTNCAKFCRPKAQHRISTVCAWPPCRSACCAPWPLTTCVASSASTAASSTHNNSAKLCPTPSPPPHGALASAAYGCMPCTAVSPPEAGPGTLLSSKASPSYAPALVSATPSTARFFPTSES